MFRMGLAIDAMSMRLLKYIPTKLIKELDRDSCDSLLMGLIETQKTSERKLSKEAKEELREIVSKEKDDSHRTSEAKK